MDGPTAFSINHSDSVSDSCPLPSLLLLLLLLLLRLSLVCVLPSTAILAMHTNRSSIGGIIAFTSLQQAAVLMRFKSHPGRLLCLLPPFRLCTVGFIVVVRKRHTQALALTCCTTAVFVKDCRLLWRHDSRSATCLGWHGHCGRGERERELELETENFNTLG